MVLRMAKKYFSDRREGKLIPDSGWHFNVPVSGFKKRKYILIVLPISKIYFY